MKMHRIAMVGASLWGLVKLHKFLHCFRDTFLPASKDQELVSLQAKGGASVSSPTSRQAIRAFGTDRPFYDEEIITHGSCDAASPNPPRHSTHPWPFWTLEPLKYSKPGRIAGKYWGDKSWLCPSFAEF